LGLNIKLKCYVYRQQLYTVRQGNGSTTTLALEVFTQKYFLADFIQLNLNFIHKNNKPPFGGVSGNVSTSIITRWKIVLGDTTILSKYRDTYFR